MTPPSHGVRGVLSSSCRATCRVACRVAVEFPVELSRPGLNADGGRRAPLPAAGGSATRAVLCPERSVLRSSQSRPPPRGGGLWVFVGSPCSPFDRPVASSHAAMLARGTIARRRRVAADGDARGGVCGLCACAPVRTSGRSGACLNSSRCTTRSPARLPALRQVRQRRRPGSALNVKMKDRSTVSILILSRRLPLYEVISL